MCNEWLGWLDEDKHQSCPNRISPSSSTNKGLDPSAAPCSSYRIPPMPNSCRPGVCHPCYTPEKCCYATGAASESECGSPLPRGLIHGDNIGRSKETLVKMATHRHHIQGPYLVGHQIWLMSIDHRHGVP